MGDRSLPERLAALMQTALFTESPEAFGDRLPEIILRAVVQAADSTAASLFLTDETLQTVKKATYISDGNYYTADTPVELPAAAAWVVQHRESLWMNYPDSESKFTASGIPGAYYAAANFVMAPLCVNDTCVGVLEAVGKCRDEAFSDDDVSLLSLTAKYATSA